MIEFEPHDYFTGKSDRKESREIFQEHIRKTYDQIRELADYIEQYEGTIDTEFEKIVTHINEHVKQLTDLYNDLLDNNVLDSAIQEKLTQLEEEYAPKLTEVTAQLQQTEESINAQLAQTSKKLTGTVNLNEYGILSDGTDQTSAITDLFANELSGFRGNLTIPYNTKFDIETVYSSAPSGAVLFDYSVINWNNSSSYKNKMITVGSNDLLADDKIFQIQSAHHPVLSLNNFGTAGSSSADNLRMSINFANGKEGDYQKVLMRQQFSKHIGLDKYSMMWILMRKYGDDETAYDQILAMLDEDGHFAIGSSTDGITNLLVKNHPSTTRTTTTAKIENSLDSSTAINILSAKDSAGVVTTGEQHLNGSQKALYQMVNGNTTHIYRENESQNRTNKTNFWYTLEDSSTPNVDGGEYFNCNANTSGTITDLTNVVKNQEITIVFSGDTPPTLVNSPSIRLKDGIDYTPAKFSSITLFKMPGVAGWVEKTRT